MSRPKPGLTFPVQPSSSLSPRRSTHQARRGGGSPSLPTSVVFDFSQPDFQPWFLSYLRISVWTRPTLFSVTIFPGSMGSSRNLPLSPEAPLAPFMASPYVLLCEPRSLAWLRARPSLSGAVRSPQSMSYSRGGPRTCSGAPAAAGKSGFVVPALSPVCNPSRQVMASHSSIRGVSHM